MHCQTLGRMHTKISPGARRKILRCHSFEAGNVDPAICLERCRRDLESMKPISSVLPLTNCPTVDVVLYVSLGCFQLYFLVTTFCCFRNRSSGIHSAKQWYNATKIH